VTLHCINHRSQSLHFVSAIRHRLRALGFSPAGQMHHCNACPLTQIIHHTAPLLDNYLRIITVTDLAQLAAVTIPIHHASLPPNLVAQKGHSGGIFDFHSALIAISINAPEARNARLNHRDLDYSSADHFFTPELVAW
jgi:hypothetical protein